MHGAGVYGVHCLPRSKDLLGSLTALSLLDLLDIALGNAGGRASVPSSWGGTLVNRADRRVPLILFSEK